MTKRVQGDTKQQHPMDPVRLAATAYHSMVEQAFAIQQRMIQREMARQMFGDKAIPIVSAFRSTRDVLANAPKHMKNEEEHDRERLDELLAQIAEMEPIFKGHADANMRAFVKEMVERFQEEG